MNLCNQCELFYFDLLSIDDIQLKNILISHKIINDETECLKCKAKVKVGNSLMYRCYNRVAVSKKKKRKCEWQASARVGTFFSNSHVPTEKLFKLITFVLFHNPPRQEFLVKNLSISSRTVVDWYSFMREVFEFDVRRNSVRLGGPGKIVEIDEAKFGKRKYNRGRIVEGQWVLGAVERGSVKACLVPVPDRTSRTLIRFIRRWCVPGSTIITDCWRAYNCLSGYGFQHYTVNHSRNFVDPDTGAHTNNIERRWRDVRSTVPRYGVRSHHFTGYLAEHMFKRKYPQEERMHAFLKAAAQLYPPQY